MLGEINGRLLRGAFKSQITYRLVKVLNFSSACRRELFDLGVDNDKTSKYRHLIYNTKSLIQNT